MMGEKCERFALQDNNNSNNLETLNPKPVLGSCSQDGALGRAGRGQGRSESMVPSDSTKGGPFKGSFKREIEGFYWGLQDFLRGFIGSMYLEGI